MGEPTLREQEQVMQTERSLVELEERERDIRQLEVRSTYVIKPLLCLRLRTNRFTGTITPGFLKMSFFIIKNQMKP